MIPLKHDEIQKQITDYINKILINHFKCRIKYYHTHFSFKSKKGFPDLWIGCLENDEIRHYFIEIKPTIKSLKTKEQIEFIDFISTDQKGNTEGYFIYSLEEFLQKTNVLGYGHKYYVL